MNYAITATVLAVLVSVAYLYVVYDGIERAAREINTEQDHDPDWASFTRLDYKVLISIVGSTALIFSLSLSPVLWHWVPFAGIAAAVGIIIAFILEKRADKDA
ncbi:hypothetical protein FEM54_14760 [Pseudomonas edaphica]|uniref:DUF3784 domain-containing protein n=1 Tax=Pseudomonas edaphica TaxID=2006980 RepID=A0ABY2U443_9PSED|nr:hypothetical protein [Pseudomonas edaphica]TLG91078.1 hypothetical protein FEM54_14760 [Pseudomonas edaphica]